MNKKLLFLMVGMIVCLSIMGGALAAAYFNADPQDAVIKTDEYLALDINTGSEGFLLESGKSVIKPIVFTYDKVGSDEDATCTATFTITASDGKTLDNVTIGLYTNESCETLVGDTLVQNGVGSFSVSGIDETTTYYLKVSFNAGEMTAEQISNVEGSILVQFVMN